jgi:hypothetical protein
LLLLELDLPPRAVAMRLLSAPRRLFMHYSARASVLVSVVLLTSSCSDTDARQFATQPSQLATSTSILTVSPTSTTIVAQPVSNAFCPTVAPFNVSLGVIVRAMGSSPVIITRVRFVFSDTSGRQAPQVTLPMLPVTLPAPGPTIPIGNATDSSTRMFSTTLGIGCGTGARGWVVVVVDTLDSQNRPGAEQVKILVR